MAYLIRIVFGDRGGFGEQHVAVFQQGGGADRMFGAQFGWGEDGDRVAGVGFELVGKFEFLAEPDDALGLRFAEMVDDEHVGDPCRVHSAIVGG